MALEATDGALAGEGIGINIFLIFNGPINLPLERNRERFYIVVE